MTMILANTIVAEVEPVPGKAGWFQLTGKDITRNTMMPASEEIAECPGIVHRHAKIVGIHGDWDVEFLDPRFNDEEGQEFAVLEVRGMYRMVLDVNRPEYVILRFLLPATTPEYDESIDEFRIEPKAKGVRPTRKKVAA